VTGKTVFRAFVAHGYLIFLFPGGRKAFLHRSSMGIRLFLPLNSLCTLFYRVIIYCLLACFNIANHQFQRGLSAEKDKD